MKSAGAFSFYGGVQHERTNTVRIRARIIKDQHTDRQIITLREMGVPEKNIFIDKQSGKDFERAQYKKLLKKMNKGSVLFVKSIDRLGRNYDDLVTQWRYITKEKHADLVVCDLPLLDTRREKNLLGTFISDLVLAIFSYVAETERHNIKMRQKEGIEAARRRGVKFGRPRRALPDNFNEIHRLWRMKKMTLKQAAKACGLPETTFFDNSRRFENTTISKKA